MGDESSVESTESRFATKTDAQRQDTLDGRIKENTKKATKVWMNVVTAYIKEKQLGVCIEEIPTDQLPTFLFNFYSEVRKDNKDLYSNTSLKAMRAAINRHLKETRSLDIVADSRFIRCNELFKGVQLEGKKAGKGTVKHKDEIEPEDFEKLQDYFSRYMEPNAEILQQYVMFNVIYYLCRRGRQNIPQLTVDMFEVWFLLKYLLLKIKLCIFLVEINTFDIN